MTTLTANDLSLILADLRCNCAERGFTSVEFAEQANVSEATALRMLRRFVKDGKVERARVQRETGWGVMTTKPGYVAKN